MDAKEYRLWWDSLTHQLMTFIPQYDGESEASFYLNWVNDVAPHVENWEGVE